jgi:hypothetical protein
MSNYRKKPIRAVKGVRKTECRTQAHILLDSQERRMIEAIRKRFGFDGVSPTLRFCLTQEFNRLPKD